MELNELREHLDTRLDRLEGKLDAAAAKGVQNETDITWLKGHARVVTTIVLAMCSFFAVAYMSVLSK